MSTSPDVIIVGGGVIGCSIAFHLAKSGVRVVVVERGRWGAGASHAASGGLGTTDESHPYDRMERESLRLFHGLAEELRELCGVDVELVKCGQLDLALSEDDVKRSKGEVSRSRELGGRASWLDAKEVREMEPEIASTVLGAVHRPENYRVNNQRVTEAFVRAARRLGAKFRQGADVFGLAHQGRRITGVRLQGEELHADRVVIAAGPWTDGIARSAGVAVPVRPVRGQNLNLQPTMRGITTIVHGSSGVLVPRNDGSIMAGVTIEEAGFDNRVTAEGVRSIMNVVISLVPQLGDASLNWAVSGLRPGSPDDMPLLGPVRGMDGLILASGHFMSGILLSPVTGLLITNLITGGDTELLSGFSPNRFVSPEPPAVPPEENI